MADGMSKVEFREFQEPEGQNNASRAKMHVQKRHTDVGMVVACHLGGRYGHIMCWNGKMAQSRMAKSKHFCLTFIYFLFLFPL